MSTFPVDASTIASWSFQESNPATNPVVEDRGNYNFNTVAGGTVVAGLVGANSRHFNGTVSDYVQSNNFGGGLAATGQGAWTVEVLLKPDTSSVNNAMLFVLGGVAGNGSGDNVQVGIAMDQTTGKFYAFWQFGNQTFTSIGQSTSGVNINQWNYIVIVKSLNGAGPNYNIDYYINGTHIGSQITNITDATGGTGNQQFSVATYPFTPHNASNAFQGAMNGVRFSNRVRTSSEITAQNSAFGLGIGPAVLTANWNSANAAQVQVTYAAPVDSTTAANPANYSIPGLTVTGASYASPVATLTTTGGVFGNSYTVTVSNVLDPTLVFPITAPFNSFSFTRGVGTTLTPPSILAPDIRPQQSWTVDTTPFGPPGGGKSTFPTEGFNVGFN